MGTLLSLYGCLTVLTRAHWCLNRCLNRPGLDRVLYNPGSVSQACRTRGQESRTRLIVRWASPSSSTPNAEVLGPTSATEVLAPAKKREGPRFLDDRKNLPGVFAGGLFDF